MYKFPYLRSKLLLLMVALFFIPSLSYSKDSRSNEKLNTFLKIAEDLFDKAQLPGAGMAIVHQGEVVYTGGFGFVDVEKKEPVDENSLFFIGSTTKAFTGFAAAKLVEQNLFDWKEPIIKYLPEFTLSEPYVAKHINLEDLFTHMSGLAQQDELWLDKDVDREEVYNQTATLPFAHSFRETWSYNNHAYVIISKVMEEVTEETWETIIEDEIFTPLEMTNSQVTYQDFMNSPNHVTGYFGDGKSPRPHSNSDNIAPAGGISSTPKDISKWLQMMARQGENQGEPFLSKKEFDYLTKPKGMSFVDTCSVQYYSIGWGGLMESMSRTLRHNGAIAGNNARVSVMPDDGFGIFIMTNQRSEYKDILTDYAEHIFVKGDFERDYERESKMISLNRFIQFQNTLLDYGLDAAKAYHSTLQFKDFEGYMLELGNSLLQAGYLEPALFVFELNVSDNPSSFEAYQKYGEALLKDRKEKEAIEAYEKALELNPNAEIAKKALESLLKD